MDWIPGREEQIARLIEDRPWDYIIGSVHFIADRAVDHDGYDIWLDSSPDEVWSAYFEALGDAAASGLFDVLAHPDLVKVWGTGGRTHRGPSASTTSSPWSGSPAPTSRSRSRRPGCASRSGEIYPASRAARDVRAAGKPVALSSDAHEPQFIGHGYDRALELLRECGVDRICVFEGRRRSEVPLG